MLTCVFAQMDICVCPGVCSVVSFKHQHASPCGLRCRCIRGHIKLLCARKMINWRVLCLSALVLSQSCLFYAKCHSIRLTADGVTAQANTRKQCQRHWIMKNNTRVWVVCLVSCGRMCKCVWRPFSTTQGTIVMLQNAQIDLWPLLTTVLISVSCVWLGL